MPGPAPAPALTRYFESAAQTITQAGALTLAHGLGRTPTLMQVVMKCNTAEGGWAVNDVLGFGFGDCDGAGTVSGQAVNPDATNLNIRFSNAVLRGNNKTTGAGFNLTVANWNAIFRAWV